MRMDLISVPYRTMPASNVSSIVKSWRALRLRATVCSSRMSVSSGFVGASFEANGPGRTNAGPGGPAFELLTHPQGVRLNGHLLRGGAATRTVDHCTSPPFVPANRTRTGKRAQEGRSRIPRGRSGGDAPRPASGLAEDLERLVERQILVGRRALRDRHDDIRGQADVVDPALVRCQPAGDGQLERAAVAELLPLLDGALAERLLADERRPLRVLERAGDDLAGRRAAGIDQADDGQIVARGDAARVGRRRRLLPVRVLLPEDDAVGDEVAGDRPGGGDEAARIAAQVQDQLGPAGVDVRLEGLADLARRPRRRSRSSGRTRPCRRPGPSSRPPSAG